MDRFDADLVEWDDLAAEEWPTLLLGNGFSANLWPGFRYGSLFEQAGLGDAAEHVFRALRTDNFELALECLHHARVTLRALGEPAKKVSGLYVEVRNALFDTVRSVHVPWGEVPRSRIARSLAGHQSVFTTNYDLSLYWSTVQPGAHDVRDFFWSGPDHHEFDAGNARVFGTGATRLHYLHGALHLWHDDRGVDGKWTQATGGSLLEVAQHYTPRSTRRPLFVSEGTSAMKRRRIGRSPYLRFCLRRLRRDEAPTVVFGHSLGPSDEHVATALGKGAPRRIAISVWPEQAAKDIRAVKARMHAALPGHDLDFFASTTHPLGMAPSTP